MFRHAKATLLTLIAAAMLCSNSSASPQSADIDPESEKPRKENLKISVPNFNIKYDVIIPNFISDIVTDSSAVWKSHTFNDSAYTRKSSMKKRTRLIDGRAKIHIYPIYHEDLEFRTYTDENGRPVESIIVTREGDDALTPYGVAIAKREFSDWQSIKTLGHTTFHYDKGVARTPSNVWKANVSDTLTYIDGTILDMQTAYFMLAERIFGRPLPFDTTVNVIYKGTKYPVRTNASHSSVSDGEKNIDCVKLIADLTREVDGERRPFVDGINQLTLYIDNRTRLPIRIDAEVKYVFTFRPYARPSGTSIEK